MERSDYGKFICLLRLLARQTGVTYQQIEEEMDCSRRTAQRHMEFIENLGFFYFDANEDNPETQKARYKLTDEAFAKKIRSLTFPDLNLTFDEIIALCLLKGEKNLYRGTEIEKDINSAFSKLLLFLPDLTREKLHEIKAFFITSPKIEKDYSNKSHIIRDLKNAIFQKKSCYVKYHSFNDNQVKNFQIDPLHFFENRGGLYIFVNASSFDDIRTLAVERIQEITITDITFKYPENFDPESLMESAFNISYGDPIDFAIWFSKDQARYIKERQWAKIQSIKENEDGSIILNMTTSGWWDVKRWVLTYGADAKVLEPESFRKEIINELKLAQLNYK